ncbi:MAG: hypothetical protein KGH58_01410 [Candidatus Micrarchaeota archaeon]|nr:hypothetical protein [Candidatus Micrarchaeota archaeon]
MNGAADMDKKLLVFLGLLGLSFILLLIASFIPLSIATDVVKLLILAVAVVANVLAFSSRYYLYMILPLFQQRTRNITLSDQSPYWLSSTSDSILRKEGDDFLATVYINIPLYRSATEMSDEEKLDFAQQVSRLVGISKEPTRFTTQLYVMNKDSYIQKLRDTITMVEEEEAKLVASNAAQSEIERVRGKSAMWRKMLDNVGRGSSLELSSYAALSARGGKEFEAISMVQQKARELMSGIGATFGVSPNIVLGNELLKFVEPEYLIPFSTISEQITKNIQEEVI